MDRQSPQKVAILVLQALIRGYQLVLSPLFPPSCRYGTTGVGPSHDDAGVHRPRTEPEAARVDPFEHELAVRGAERR